MRLTQTNRLSGLVALALALGGCASNGGAQPGWGSDAAAGPSASSTSSTSSASWVINSASGLRQAQAEGLTRSQIMMRSGAEFLAAGDLAKAQQVFNTGLKFDAANAPLHFLNALAYHVGYLQGEVDKLALAEAGYRAALMHDPAMDLAYLQLGRLLIDAKDYRRAKQAMALAVDADRRSVDAHYGLAQAALFDGDLPTSYWAAGELDRLQWRSPQLFRLKAMQAAITGQTDRAQALASDYARAAHDPADAKYLSSRVDRLLASYSPADGAAARPLLLAQADASPQAKPAVPTTAATAAAQASETRSSWFRCNPNPGVPPAPSSGPPVTPVTLSDETTVAAALPAPCAGEKPQAAMFEVTMIRTSESNNRAFGINLLDGLAAVLTSKSSSTFSTATGTGDTVRSRSLAFVNSSASATADALRYSLNIANSAYGKNEVISRPTIAAIDRVPAVFFSGATLTLGIPGAAGSASSIVDKPIGVSLSVTPTFVDDNTVLVAMRATRSLIETSLTSNPALLLQQTRNAISASALLNFGDTYVLGGLVEKEADYSDSGTPVLQDIPVLQYLFKHSVKSEFSRQVLTLITVRRLVDRDADGQPLREGDISTHQMSRAVAEYMGNSANKTAIEQVMAGLRTDSQPYRKLLRARDMFKEEGGETSRLRAILDSLKEAAYF